MCNNGVYLTTIEISQYASFNCKGSAWVYFYTKGLGSKGGNTPQGAKSHVAWFGNDGLHVLDLWESQADFERFMQESLMPGIQRFGFQGQPKVEFTEAYAMFAPDV